MKSTVIILSYCLLITNSISAQLNVTSGTSVVMGPGSYLVLNDISVINNSTFIQVAGTVKLTGLAKKSLYGPGSYQFYNLEVAKSGGEIVQLISNIAVQNQILFTSGYLDLNGNVVSLGTNALLNGENELSRVLDFSNAAAGYVQVMPVINAPSSYNAGNLGAIISSLQNLGTTTIRRGHKSQMNGSNTGKSIVRYYDISPTNNVTATLRLKYFDAELNNLNETGLEMFSSPDNSTWTKQGFDSRDANQNYVEKNISSFSRWTLSNCSTGLDPTFLSTFYADADGDGYGNAASSLQACTLPQGYVTNNTDCNDNDEDIYPGAPESCYNNDDDNCNGIVNEGCELLPTISINDVTVYESQGIAVLTVSLSHTSTLPVGVKYATANGTATAPRDYKKESGDVIIPAGSLSATISITIYPDNIVEPNEYFDVKLSRSANALIADNSGRVTIVDGAPLLVQKSQKLNTAFKVDAHPNPTSGDFTITILSAENSPVQVRLLDVSGQVRKNVNSLSNRFVLNGDDLLPGIYLLEVKQGNKMEMLKLVKL